MPGLFYLLFFGHGKTFASVQTVYPIIQCSVQLHIHVELLAFVGGSSAHNHIHIFYDSDPYGIIFEDTPSSGAGDVMIVMLCHGSNIREKRTGINHVLMHVKDQRVPICRTMTERAKPHKKDCALY